MAPERTPEADSGEHVSEDEKQEREDDVRRRNPDRTTRREALELELMEEDRSEAGEEIGDEID